MEHTGYIPPKYDILETAMCGICGEVADIIHEDESIDHEFGRHHQHVSYTKCCESLSYYRIIKDTKYPKNPEYIRKLLEKDIISFNDIEMDDEITIKQFTQHNKEYTLIYGSSIIEELILIYDLDNNLIEFNVEFTDHGDELSVDNPEKDILIYKRYEI